MFLPFFQAMRQEGVPVSLREFLDFLAALSAGLARYDPEGFYVLARTVMVKDERYLDRFDRAFAQSFQGLEAITPAEVLQGLDLPSAWLDKLAEQHLTAQERAAISALGGFEALMQALQDRLATQKERHQGGNKWIGTSGTSPFGAHGYNPEGLRIGQDQSRHQRAVKVWDKRAFRNLDERAEFSGRAMTLALRRLRKWARDGASAELDLEGTIRATAQQGWLDVQLRPARRNAVKVLLFFDIGGSMDPYVAQMQALFSAARAEFKHLLPFYFHNCLYEAVWRDPARRWSEQTPTLEVFRNYGSDYKAIFVGDAAMSPYEILQAGGANEHWNPESGQLWLQRACAQWPNHLWINPLPQAQWRQTPSIQLISQIFAGRMVPMTLEGLSCGIRALR